MLVGLSVSRLEATELSDHRYCPAVPIGRLRSRIDWAKVIVGIRLPSPSLFEMQAGAAQHAESQMAPIPLVHSISACGLSADQAKFWFAMR